MSQITNSFFTYIETTYFCNQHQQQSGDRIIQFVDYYILPVARQLLESHLRKDAFFEGSNSTQYCNSQMILRKTDQKYNKYEIIRQHEGSFFSCSRSSYIKHSKLPVDASARLPGKDYLLWGFLLVTIIMPQTSCVNLFEKVGLLVVLRDLQGYTVHLECSGLPNYKGCGATPWVVQIRQFHFTNQISFSKLRGMIVETLHRFTNCQNVCRRSFDVSNEAMIELYSEDITLLGQFVRTSVKRRQRCSASPTNLY